MVIHDDAIEATDLHDLTGMAQHHTLFGWHLANPLHASGQVREGRTMEKVKQTVKVLRHKDI